MSTEINVSFPPDEIKIFVGDDVITRLEDLLDKHASSEHFYFLVDESIYSKYESVLRTTFDKPEVHFFLVKGGKSNKTFASAMRVFADLDNHNFDRSVAIVAMGGGVVGDLGGFVASCWYRGVELVHVPTTLLSAVDSCLGGKTALNFRSTANAVGTYHHPSTILIDTSVLADLPDREISSGFGEIIKYATLGSLYINNALESTNAITEESIEKLVSESLRLKAELVTGDVKESNQRLFLNFGHTIGHAIEFATIHNGDEVYRHGEGVGLGMLAIFRVCVTLGYLKESDLQRLTNLLLRFGLPTQVDSSLFLHTRESLASLILDKVLKDKKRTRTGLRLVLLDGWGKPFIYETSDLELIKAGVLEVIK